LFSEKKIPKKLIYSGGLKIIQRLNLKNLSRISNLRRGSNMVGFTWNCIQCFKIWADSQLEMIFDGSPTRFKFSKLSHWFLFFTWIKITKVLSSAYACLKGIAKELSLFHKLKFSNPYISFQPVSVNLCYLQVLLFDLTLTINLPCYHNSYIKISTVY